MDTTLKIYSSLFMFEQQNCRFLTSYDQTKTASMDPHQRRVNRSNSYTHKIRDNMLPALTQNICCQYFGCLFSYHYMCKHNCCLYFTKPTTVDLHCCMFVRREKSTILLVFRFFLFKIHNVNTER